jgi:1-acylglycerone phosphate reductase
VESLEGFRHSGIRKLTVDVLVEDDIKRAIQFIIAEEGKLDIVVSNAGALCIGTSPPRSLSTPLTHISIPVSSFIVELSGPVIDINTTQAQECFDVNVLGTLRLARAAIPHMAAKKKGLFVTIGSVAGT